MLRRPLSFSFIRSTCKIEPTYQELQLLVGSEVLRVEKLRFSRRVSLSKQDHNMTIQEVHHAEE